MPSTFEAVMAAIRRERHYQDMRWGTPEENPHAMLEWSRIASDRLSRATSAGVPNEEAAALLLRTAAVCVAALEQHGAPDLSRPILTPVGPLVPGLWYVSGPYTEPAIAVVSRDTTASPLLACLIRPVHPDKIGPQIPATVIVASGWTFIGTVPMKPPPA